MRPSSLRRLRPAAKLAGGVLLAVSLALAGCGQPASKPTGRQPQAAKPPVKAQSGTSAPAATVYAYNAEGKLDPFRPFGVGPAKKKPAAQHQGSPLSQMDVGSFKLVGVADSPGGRMALVQDGSGRGYVLSTGMTVGVSGGVVKEISLDGVSVEERVRDYAGRLRTKTIVLKLAQEEER